MTDRSVYISYRHNFSSAMALAIFHELSGQGCDVFINPARSDERDALDLSQIEARAHFVVVVTPNLVEPLQLQDDPMALEIDHAVDQRRSIIPLLTNGFSFSSTVVADKVHRLRRYYAVTVTPETVEQSAETLNQRLIDAHFFGKLTPTPSDQVEAAARRVAAAERQPVPALDELRAEVLFNHAHLRVRHDHTGKLADYDEALRLNPEHAYAHFDRGSLRRRDGDEVGALADYDEAVRLNPQFYNALNNRAELYFAHGQYQKALSDYERVIAVRPDYVMSLAGQALTLHALNQIEPALTAWRSLLVQDERYFDAAWVGRELHLPSAMIDETHHLLQHLNTPPYAPDH